MNFRIIGRFVTMLAVGLIFFSATLQPAALAAPAFQDEDSMAEGQEYTIQAGDSLYKISSAFLGNGNLWPQIQEATNAMAAEDNSFATIDQPRLIRAGQKIWIPVASKGEMMDESSGDEMDHTDGQKGEEEEGASEDETDGDSSQDLADDEMVGNEADSEEVMTALANAVDQLGIAVSHAGFVADALATDDLTMAQTHAEHVINILDGEEGRSFGDVNRDGKSQNPGDGVGVRGYLTEAQDARDADETSGAQNLLPETIDTALRIFAVDTAEEAIPISDDLSAMLDQLAAALDTEQSSDGMMTDDEMANEASMDEGMLPDFLLAAAATEVETAIAHNGFLTDELEAGELDAAKSHAEHVINILDGEEGLFFGDINRDGQTQNPGDGTGVRVYLEQALAQVQSADSDASDDLASALDQGLILVKDASESALELFTVDSVGDAESIAETLTASLTDLQAFIGEMQEMAPPIDMGTEMGVGEDGDTAAAVEGGDDSANVAETVSEDDAAGGVAENVTEDVLLAVQSLLSDTVGEGALLNAKAQAEAAATHYSFLHDSLDSDDLAMALAHAEHVINILDGEDGSLFGDNNRDGQTQNPGDGIGVRAYLADAGEQMTAALGTAANGGVTDEGVQTLLDAIAESAAATTDSAGSAVRLFTADSATDAQPLADELGASLAGLQESIAAAMSAAAEVR